MAYETENVQSTGQRISNALTGAMKGAQQGFDMAQSYKQTQIKQQELQQNQVRLDDQHKETQMKLYDTANKQIASIFDVALETGDPEAAMNVNRDSYERWAKFGDIKTPFEDTVAQLKDGSKIVGPASKAISEALSILNDPNPASSFQKKQEAYLRGTEALSKAKVLARNPIYGSYFGIKKNILDQALSEASKQQQAYNVADIAAKAKEAAAASKPDPGFVMSEKEEAKNLVKQKALLPGLQNRQETLDAALKVFNNVKTGPIAGQDYAQYLQSLSNEDQQRLTQYLSIEGVNAIMDFASKAGVRAIDTDKEREGLLSTVSNAKQSPKVLKESLQRMKRIITASQDLIRAKQKHFIKYKQLTNFDPETLGVMGEEIGSNKPQELSAEDQAAVSWAKKNSKDLRAIEILKLNPGL